MELVTLEAAQPLLAHLTPQQRGAGQRTMQDLEREIKRLGVVVEVVEPPPPMAVMPAPVKPAPLVAPMAAAERAIPGLMPIRSASAPALAPAYRPQTTASASTSSTTALVEQPYQQDRPKK